MQFRVSHVTRYAYTVPVELGTHVLRLVPQGPSLTLKQHTLDIRPSPTNLRREVDTFGNEVAIVEFLGPTVEFYVSSQFEAETGILPAPDDSSWPSLPWPEAEDAELSAFVKIDPIAREVTTFAREVAERAQYRPLSFLDILSQTLFSKVDRGIRLEGAAQPAEVTLATLRGACRDVSVLFLECCRAMGFIGRFVSGYQAAADTPNGERHLHAWAEVYLPGAGWRGWDAMHGLRVQEGHIPLCGAPGQASTMPVDGRYAFSGPSVTSTLDFSVRIETS
jgi:transglutaminase-like putative cysteine protease